MRALLKILILSIVVAFGLSSCATTYNPKPKKVTKSFYLNKSLMLFEMDNGYCYAREPLNNGGYKNYWQSDKGNILANLMDWDSYPYCKLALIQIKIIKLLKLRY